MKCVSCEFEIDPKWKHAVDMNQCPSCGNAIMDENLKSLLATLSKTVDSLAEFPDVLEDWMKTYGYVHRDKIPKQSKVKEVVRGDDGEIIDAPVDESVNKFFKNAGVDRVVSKKQHMQSLLSKIRDGSDSVDMSGGVMSRDMMESADPEAVAEYHAMMGGESEDEIYSSSQSYDDDGDDDIPPAVLAMANKARGNSNKSNQSNDLEKLQKMQARSAKNRMTGGSGSFSR